MANGIVLESTNLGVLGGISHEAKSQGRGDLNLVAPGVPHGVRESR
jgi:hypothetical protein